MEYFCSSMSSLCYFVHRAAVSDLLDIYAVIRAKKQRRRKRKIKNKDNKAGRSADRTRCSCLLVLVLLLCSVLLLDIVLHWYILQPQQYCCHAIGALHKFTNE